MNQQFDSTLPQPDAEPGPTDSASSQRDPAQSGDVSEGVLAAAGRCLRQLQDSIEAGAELGQIEFALFRMGLVRMLLLGIAVCGLLLSLWLVLLAASWAALMAMTGSPLLAFAGLAVLIPLGVIWACLKIRHWYRLSFFPRTRRQLDATLREWSTSP
jgi:hypothetical protein